MFVTLEVDQESAAASWQGAGGGNEAIGAATDKVTGLGDKAFFGPRDVLYVLSADTFVMVEAGFDDKVRERGKKVAKLVLDKLE